MSASLKSPSMNCYEVLQVAQYADINEINTAYKRLALKLHPDKTGGDTVFMDEFRKIQQAVEVLRDPLRRIRHDDELRRIRKRQGLAFIHQQSSVHVSTSSGAAAAHSDPTSSSGDPSSTGWVPHHARYHFGGERDRYMWSYSNSVHMTPGSADSVEELKRCEAERKETEEWRFKLFQEKEREDRRKQAMRMSFMRGYYEEEEEEEDIVEGADFGVSSCPVHEHFDNDDVKATDKGKEKLDEVPMHVPDDDMYSIPCEEDDDTCRSDTSSSMASATEYATAKEDLSSSNDDGESVFDTPSENRHTDTNKTSSEPDEDPPAYEDYSTIASSETHAPTPVLPTDLTEEQYAKWDPTAQFNAFPINMDSAISPFIPYFNAKLNQSGGRYTPADLHSELQGLLLETFCGWLETQRLTIPGARPLETGLTPEQCSHLGYWTKDFDTYECESCHRWMPMYTLTCPGCGIKACISCKFHYVAV